MYLELLIFCCPGCVGRFVPLGMCLLLYSSTLDDGNTRRERERRIYMLNSFGESRVFTSACLLRIAMKGSGLLLLILESGVYPLPGHNPPRHQARPSAIRMWRVLIMTWQCPWFPWIVASPHLPQCSQGRWQCVLFVQGPCGWAQRFYNKV